MRLGVRIFLLVKFSVVCLVHTENANSLEHKYKPWTLVSLDYHGYKEPLIGISIAPNHYDRPYYKWGYYLGYARSKTVDIETPGPSTIDVQHRIYRLGLSFSFSNDLSLYGGPSFFESLYNGDDGVMFMSTGGAPSPVSETVREWGAELGVRYALSEHWLVSAGYNSTLKSIQLGLGYRGSMDE